MKHLCYSCRFFLVLLALIPLFLNAQNDIMPVLKITYTGSLNKNDYIPGTMQLTETNGTVVELNTLFKTRGATSLHYTKKPSMNMKIRDAEGNELDTTLLGLRHASSFILDAMAIDRINMRNRVCFDIWNAFSRLPYETDFGSRNGTVGAFVELYINNDYKGIYCLSDKINRKLLGLKKPKTDDYGNLTAIRGVLYKNGTNDVADQNTEGLFNGGSVCVIRYHDAWELQEPDDYPCEEAWAALYNLYADGHHNNYQWVKDNCYLQNLADYTILIIALSIQDNWGAKNRYLSVVNTQGTGNETRFVTTPWDLDTSLGGHYNGNYYDGNYSNWAISDITKNPPKPISTVMGQQEFKTLLRNTWIRGRWGAFAVDAVKQRMYDYCDMFESSGAWQRTVEAQPKTGERIVDNLRQEIDLIGLWYENRFNEIDEYFGVSDADLPQDTQETQASVVAPKGIYNLQGMQLEEATQPGLYIIDGEKILIK